MRAGAESEPGIEAHDRGIGAARVVGHGVVQGTIQVRAPNRSSAYWSIQARSQS